MVQSPVQQVGIDKRRKNISQTYQQALSIAPQISKNLQQKQRENQLLLYA